MRRLAFAAAAVVAAVLIVLSVDRSFYAPGAHALRGLIVAVFGEEAGGSVRTAWLLRKLYSVVAFAIAGFALAAALRPVRRRFAVATLGVAALSTVIEIVQKADGSPESLRSNLFDVGCGALGGLIGAVLVTAARR